MPKILAIDDTRDNLISISALLGKLIPDCTVITSDSGEKGIKRAETEQPDTILLDTKMPEMDGFEVCRRLKSNGETKHIPVVMLTAMKSDVESRVKGLELGADAFLSKPIDEVELAAHVKVMLRIKTAEDLLRKEKDLLKDAVYKRAKALRESEEKYRSVVESTEDSIYLVERNGAYLFMNKRHLSRFGMKEDKVIGERYDDFHSKEETKAFKGRVNKVIETDKSHRYVYQSEKDGGYYLRTLSPVKDPEGNTVAVTVVSKDITEFKMIEEDLRQANEELSWAQNQRKILSERLIGLLENDRRVVSRELHDHIGQVLTSLKMDIEMIHGKLKPEHGELETRITAAQEKTIQAIRDVKNISRGLRPAMLDALGLLPSLRELFNEIQHQTDMEVHFFSRNIPKRIAPEKALAIYRIAQEALTNIIRHAQAKNVFVNLIKKDETFSLSAEDDGIGFDQDKVMTFSKKKGPLGLLIMRERAEQLGGDFTLESHIGKGTHLLVEIPL
ncbi:MAG: response regulator [Nitrospina sp.]|nr:response regulator [Nitrospina sp.]